ncbi:MAG: S41 family peptidase [Pseudomonadota bacterium]
MSSPAGNNDIIVSVPDLPEEFGSFGKTLPLSELAKVPSAFEQSDRLALLDQAILCLGNFYVHQTLKWTKHAVDPVQALRRLRRICGEMGDLEFHIHVSRIFKSLRDIHTAYVLPQPYRRYVAILPFTVASYRPDPAGPRKVVVRDLLESLQHEYFQRGAEILTWNGIPIERAIRNEGAEESGSNPHAQYALGERMMTIRWLGSTLPPLADQVTLGYRDALTPGGQEPDGGSAYHEIRLPWRLLDLDGAGANFVLPLQAELLLTAAQSPKAAPPPASAARKANRNARGKAKGPKRAPGTGQQLNSYDRRGTVENAALRALYGDKPDADAKFLAKGAQADRASDPFETTLPAVFEARTRWALMGKKTVEFGYLRIHNFMADDEEFFSEFARLLDLMPPDRLLIDLRGNAGGNLNCAERVMQLLTPHKIDPLPFQFLATPGTETLVHSRVDDDLKPWTELVSTAVANGYMFSRQANITPVDTANDTGQRYYGSIGLLVDAITYSTGDIFAALFADHHIGPIIGTSPNTGGGGANMWMHDLVEFYAPEEFGVKTLPHGAGLHYAIRRCVRVGAEAGSPIEEAGVAVDELHQVTYADLRQADRDLMRTGLTTLDKNPRRMFSATGTRTGEFLEVTVRTEKDKPPLSVDVYLHGRPVEAPQTKDGVWTDIYKVTDNFDAHLRLEVYEDIDGAYKSWDRRLIAVYDRSFPIQTDDA